MIPARDLLIRTLRTPDVCIRFSLSEWDTLVRQARAAGLLARLTQRLRQYELSADIPAPARWHFETAEALANTQLSTVRWQLQSLRAALAAPDTPLIALRGAAYAAANLPAAEGRLFSGIDILLPRERLRQARSSLRAAGWHTARPSGRNRRDERWGMQQTPPIPHGHDAMVALHHAILPAASRRPLDFATLRGRAVAVDGLPGVYVPAAEDRILHAATHLFLDGDLAHGLRNLTDLDLLLRDVATDRDFWPRLTARAEELQLGRSLFYALRYLGHFLGAPVPDGVAAALDAAAPNRATLALMDSIFTRALAPDHASCADAYTAAARQAASARARWLRMPAHRLVPHLFRKARVRADQREPKPA